MPKLDLDAVPQTNATGYPVEFADKVQGRWHRNLTAIGGLTDFGASHTVLKPGAWSGQRHWHVGEDELVVIIDGEAVLVDDTGEQILRAGDIAAFPKNDGNGHVLINRSTADCIYVAIGQAIASDCFYPDIDLHLSANDKFFTRKDGSTFETAD